jgi:hypothetical protein
VANRTISGIGDWNGGVGCNRWSVIHLWAGGARKVELKAVHLWVNNHKTSGISPVMAWSTDWLMSAIRRQGKNESLGTSRVLNCSAPWQVFILTGVVMDGLASTSRSGGSYDERGGGICLKRPV